jgi:hypothetical protein
VLYEDNKAAILFADHPGGHRRCKYIDTRRHFVRETVVNGEIALVYIPTAGQWADDLTKALPLTTTDSSDLVSQQMFGTVCLSRAFPLICLYVRCMYCITMRKLCA